MVGARRRDLSACLGPSCVRRTHVGPQKRPGHGHLGYDFSPGVFDFSWDVFSHNVFLRSPLTSITVGAAPQGCGPTPLPDRRDELDAPLHAPDFLLGVGRRASRHSGHGLRALIEGPASCGKFFRERKASLVYVIGDPHLSLRRIRRPHPLALEDHQTESKQ